ncbi:sterol desaturase family protein, partial [Streptomyces sp. NPDC059168]|uniref:sterol desaturase family protein n=1 Tax=Streptomyces sp. NPDC059168 TaxID=3346753 RepID=UPI00367DDF8A
SGAPPDPAGAAVGVVDARTRRSRTFSLVHRFFPNTGRVDRLWRPVEPALDTPSHHRVHHGSNSEYLDRDHGGILIIRDRLFGTFEPEGARVVYGLTKNIGTRNPLRVAFHAYTAAGGTSARPGPGAPTRRVPVRAARPGTRGREVIRAPGPARRG